MKRFRLVLVLSGRRSVYINVYINKINGAAIFVVSSLKGLFGKGWAETTITQRLLQWMGFGYLAAPLGRHFLSRRLYAMC